MSTLLLKASLKAKFFLWKLVFIHMWSRTTNYYYKNFALRLALKRRQTRTRKWPTVKHTHAHTRPQKSRYGEVYLDERDWFLVLSSSQWNFVEVLVLLLAQWWNRLNGFRTILFLRPTFAKQPFNLCWTNVGQIVKTFNALALWGLQWKSIFFFTSIHFWISLSRSLQVVTDCLFGAFRYVVTNGEYCYMLLLQAHMGRLVNFVWTSVSVSSI